MCKGGERMKSVSEQRERIIGLNGERPKAKDVPDGTIFEDVSDSTVKIAYHGRWYEKKNVELRELDGKIAGRLPFVIMESHIDGESRPAFNFTFNVNDFKRFFGLIYVNSPDGELWAFTLSGSGSSVNRLTNSNSSVDIEITHPADFVYVFTNVGSTHSFEVIFLDLERSKL